MKQKDPAGDQIKLPEDLRRRVSERLTSESVEGRISCARAQAIAQTLGVSYRVVGHMADELGIRIRECQLGCF